MEEGTPLRLEGSKGNEGVLMFRGGIPENDTAKKDHREEEKDPQSMTVSQFQRSKRGRTLEVKLLFWEVGRPCWSPFPRE